MTEYLSPVIETKNLGKKYPIPKGYRELLFQPFLKKEKPALENVSIRVQQGEIFGILGPNGSGKTTLLKILSTLILPSSGYALIHGMDIVKHEKEIKSIIGVVVSDERSFYWRLTGRENLSFFRRPCFRPSSGAIQLYGGFFDFMPHDCLLQQRGDSLRRFHHGFKKG